MRSLSLVKSKFGRLTVLTYEGRNKGYDSLWMCKCECGSELIVRGGVLKNGHTQSCGCLQRERTSESRLTHGLYRDKITQKRSKLYHVWGGIKERCFNPKNDAYKYYGAIGISMDNEWRFNYLSFHNWAISKGYEEGLTVERINPHGNYEPNNCKWATRGEQAKNKRNTRKLTYKGSTKKVLEWAEILNIPSEVLNQRVRRGWPIEKVLTTKI